MRKHKVRAEWDRPAATGTLELEPGRGQDPGSGLCVLKG